MMADQSNLARAKKFQEQAEVRKTLAPTVRSPPKFQASIHSIHSVYSKDITQMHEGSVIVASVSLSTYESCLNDFVSPVLLVFSIPLAPTILAPLLFWGSLSSA